MPLLLYCCTNRKPHITDGTPHNSYNHQQSVCPTCCPVALTVLPKVQTVHHTFAIVSKVSLYFLLHFCTNSKPQSTDGTPHNCYSDQQSVCLTCCHVAPTVSDTVQTVHRTIAIVTKRQSALPDALLH